MPSACACAGPSLVGLGFLDAQELSPRSLLLQGFNWTLFIQSVLSSVKITLLPHEEVVVYGIPYLQNLEEIIHIYPPR